MSDGLFCFIGTDGSGKSTASKIFLKMLENSGRKCHSVWGAYDLWLLRPVITTAKKIFLRNPSPYKNYGEYSKELKKASKKKRLLHIYKVLVFCEYWVELLVKVRFPLWQGRTVICDRYVFDTVINIASNLDLSLGEFGAMLNRWMSFFPEPELVIYASVPPEISVARKNDIPDIEYVIKRFYYYKAISRFWPVVEIDGTLPIPEIEKKLEELYRVTIKG